MEPPIVAWSRRSLENCLDGNAAVTRPKHAAATLTLGLLWLGRVSRRAGRIPLSLSSSIVRHLAWLTAAALLTSVPAALAQVTPAAGHTPPDDAPSIKIGTTIYLDWYSQSSPKATDADGNEYSPTQFEVGRAYINVTGNVSHLFSFRVTPDVSRETGLGSTVNGSYVLRLKYVFGQINLDDWMSHGSWIRFGLNQTPYLDFMEGIYGYRFQGTMSPERAGLITSSDAGVSFHYNLPKNFGDFHVGVYNGEGYSHFEANGRKGFQGRVSVRPLPRQPVLKGLRITGFLIRDSYVKDGPRNRGIVAGTFEHPYATAGVEYFTAADQKSVEAAKADSNGYSFWVIPKSTTGWQGLIRYDHFRPDKNASGARNMTILGVSYWFPHTGSATAALLLDYEQVNNNDFVPPRETQKRIYLHALVSY